MSDAAAVAIAVIAIVPSTVAAVLGFLNRRDIGTVNSNVDGVLSRLQDSKEKGDIAIGAGEEAQRQHARQVVEDDRKV